MHDLKIQKILDLIGQQPYWTTADLAEKLKISRSTAQNCIRELHDSGLAERIHGGVKQKISSYPIPVDKRISLDTQSKIAICRQAAKMLPRHGYIFLDAGTTTAQLGQIIALSNNSAPIVVTNDITIATVLSKHEKKHILTGGNIHPITQSISGTLAMETIETIDFDICFISTDHISPQGRLGCAIAEEAALKSKVIQRSEQRVLLAASSKLKKGTGLSFAKLSDFNCWITDTINPAAKKIAKQANINIVESNGD
jgi:DeoR family fructose operon transcriptional repressor